MSQLLGINHEFPVGNAAGWCKSVEGVEKLSRSAAQFVVVGSFTIPFRSGNEGNTFNSWSLNSLGLPNPGLEGLRAMAKDMIRLAHDAGKKIILSVAGFSPEEFVELAVEALKLGFDGVEFNFGCPNVADGGKRKPIFSFDINLMKWVLMRFNSVAVPTDDFFVSAKVSPMSNPLQIVETADMMRFLVDAVVTQNTFPNGLLYNPDGSPQIQTPDKTGWAGFAGINIKAMALGQVNQWRVALDSFGAESVEVWGVGGVQSGLDVHDMQRAGASVVQVGTAYFVNGPKIFGEIAANY